MITQTQLEEIKDLKNLRKECIESYNRLIANSEYSKICRTIEAITGEENQHLTTEGQLSLLIASAQNAIDFEDVLTDSLNRLEEDAFENANDVIENIRNVLRKKL